MKTFSDNHYKEDFEENEKRVHRGEREYTQEQEDQDMEKYYAKKGDGQ